MPRRARSATTATFFHAINRSARKQPLFLTPRDYRAFLAILNEGLTRHPVRLISYCLLANHWHLVLGPVGTDGLSSLLHWVTTTHAVRWHRRGRTVGQGAVYQGRFKAQAIMAPDQLMRACRYVERNALTAGLVRKAQDWPWCSLAARLLLRSDVPLASTPFLASNAWIDYVNSARPGDDDPWSSVPQEGKSVENRPVPLRD
jgi:putative transposase